MLRHGLVWQYMEYIRKTLYSFAIPEFMIGSAYLGFLNGPFITICSHQIPFKVQIVYVRNWEIKKHDILATCTRMYI